MGILSVELGRRIPVKRIENPQTITDHLRNRQLELKISQVEMARRIGVRSLTISMWKTNTIQPDITLCPKIIQFLGYNPFPINTDTLAGRMKKFRIENGLSQEAFAKLVGLYDSTIRRWENGGKTKDDKREILEKFLNQTELSK